MEEQRSRKYYRLLVPYIHTYILQLVSLAFLLYLLVHWLERTAATTSDNIRTYMSCTDLYYNLQYSIDMGQD